MPFDGSGNYVPPGPPTFPAIPATTISSTYFNAVIADIATALSTTFTRDGQSTVTGDMDFGGFELDNAVIPYDPAPATPALSNTVNGVIYYNTPLTPSNFAYLVSGGIVPSGLDDTLAFVALAARSTATGRAIHIPDLGTPYLIQADQFIVTPPITYNSLNKRPPAFTMDKSAVIKATSGGAFLVQFGTLASDYSGYLRDADYDLGIIDDGGFAFTKAALYVPFFFDIRMNRTVRTSHLLAATRAAWFGDTTAPAASAGLKGSGGYEREISRATRTVTSITNGANPTITFNSANALWPTSGDRVICINFTGTTPGVNWGNINNQLVDITFTGANTATIKNVNSTTWGAAPASTAYMNFASSRIPKTISGVTNANPCVITTTLPHLLTSGNTVDISQIFSMPNLIGQYIATVTGANTFSIPLDTTSTATWGTWGSFGPGWIEQWVPHASCDIGEYRDNATDMDDSQLYVKHQRIGIYNNPATCGYDGKQHGSHFYNFPEAGILRCAYYLGGDNNAVQVQIDGPVQTAFWAFGGRNASTNCSINSGGVPPKLNYFGTLVRTETGAGWSSKDDRLKSASGSALLFSEHVGLGTFSCLDTIWSNVAAPAIEFGAGHRAAACVFSMVDGVTTTNFQATGPFSRNGGGLVAGDRLVTFARPVPLNCYLLASVGGAAFPTSALTVEEDMTYGGRTVFARRIITRLAGTGVDATEVSLQWCYPD